MKTITKKLIIQNIAQKKRLDPKNVKLVLEDFFDLVSSNLEKGNRFELRNFGVFEVVERKAKVGRNPKSPEKSIPIPERKAVKFTPGRKVKSLVAD